MNKNKNMSENRAKKNKTENKNVSREEHGKQQELKQFHKQRRTLGIIKREHEP